MNALSEAMRIGEAAYQGKIDKAGAPAWDHCCRVLERAVWMGVNDQHAKAAALLHDAIEDGVIGWRAILHLPERTKDLIGALTRRPDGTTYAEYIRRIADSFDADLIRIKLADNLDNSDPERLARLPDAGRGLRRRYAMARRTLEAALASLPKGE